MENELQQIISLLKDVSPFAYDAALKSVLWTAYGFIGVGILMLVGCIICAVFAIAGEEIEFWIISTVCLLIGLITLWGGVFYLNTLEYKALEEITRLIK